MGLEMRRAAKTEWEGASGEVGPGLRERGILGAKGRGLQGRRSIQVCQKSPRG